MRISFVGDAFENGVSFMETQSGQIPKLHYSPKQSFKVVDRCQMCEIIDNFIRSVTMH